MVSLRRSSRSLASSQNGRRSRSNDRSGKKKKGSLTKSSSAPDLRRVRSIMRINTLDESLHSSYGHHSTSDIGDSCRSTSSISTASRSVSWDRIQIREYARSVSDNPSCSSGPPVGIDWEYDPQEEVLSVDEYEDGRAPRRDHCEMVLPRNVRTEMLMKEWGVPRSQVASAVRNAIKTKNQRRQTVNNLGKMTKVEEAFESAGRKMKRTFLGRKRDSALLKQWQEDVKVAAAKLAIAETNALEGDTDSEYSRIRPAGSREEEEARSIKSDDSVTKPVSEEFSPESTNEADKAGSAEVNGSAPRGKGAPIVCREESEENLEKEEESKGEALREDVEVEANPSLIKPRATLGNRMLNDSIALRA